MVEAVVDLPNDVRETSGMIFHKDALWTHNDSGNDAILYQIDTGNGDVLASIALPIEAIDLEDATTDSKSLYLADFGNNVGQRRDLRIFKFPKKILNQQAIDANTHPDTISFYYPEQTSFPGSYNHNFDAEALIPLGDMLLIFTKNWANKQSVVYQIPKEKGHHAAQAIYGFDSKGLITSAVSTRDKVYLLGYNFSGSNSPFLISFERSGDLIKWDQSARWNIDLDRQTEAIAVDGSGHLWITAEKGRERKATLFRLQP